MTATLPGIPLSNSTIGSSRLSHLRIVYPQQVFKRKNLLLLKSDNFWKIEAGVVRSLTWDTEGRIMTLGFWGKGDIVGTPLSRIKPYQMECLSEVKVTEISPESSYLEKALLVHIWKNEEFLSIINQFLVADRLFTLLEWLASQFGQSTSEGILLNLYLTHQDFADTIAATRVTVTRLMKQFEQEGKIKREGRLLKIFSNYAKD